MLVITTEPSMGFLEDEQRFVPIKPVTVRLEHSLISISKWESRYERSFMPAMIGGPRGKLDVKTEEELEFYIQCMVIGKASETTLSILETKYGLEIRDYMEAPHTATPIYRPPTRGPKSTKIITSELIYSWMIEYGIPFECERWHLNRLLTLIDVRNIQLDPNNKMTTVETLRRNANINARRLAEQRS